MGQSAAVTALKKVVRKEERGGGGGSPFESSVASAGNQGTGVAVCAEVAFAAFGRGHTNTRAHGEEGGGSPTSLIVQQVKEESRVGWRCSDKQQLVE